MQGFEFQVVTTLPEVGEAGTYYLLTDDDRIPSLPDWKIRSTGWAYTNGRWELLESPVTSDGIPYVIVDKLPIDGMTQLLYMIPRTDGIYFGYLWDPSEQVYCDIGIFEKSELNLMECVATPGNIDKLVAAVEYAHPGPVANAFRTVARMCTPYETQALFDLINAYDKVTEALK